MLSIVNIVIILIVLWLIYYNFLRINNYGYATDTNVDIKATTTIYPEFTPDEIMDLTFSNDYSY